MNCRTDAALRAAEQAVQRLLEACAKGGPLYAACPRLVAHANRTAKWLLSALAALRAQLAPAPDQEGPR